MPRLLAVLCTVLVTTGAAHAAAPSPPQVVAPEAIVIDGWTGSVLYAKNASVERYPASTVKIMTALVVLRSGVPLHRVVAVNPSAVTVGGTTAGLYAGELMSVGNLLHGMLLPSGNDAAYALAYAIGGTPDHFVGLMNAEARRLHLWHTHYLTPNGFDRWGQVTTARDLADLARVAMQKPAFARIVHTRSWSAWSADRRYFHHWTNLNKLLWEYRPVNGIKTGTTPGAGACLVSSARMHGKWVVAVNMGSTVASRFSDGIALLNYGLLVDSGPPGAR